MGMLLIFHGGKKCDEKGDLLGKDLTAFRNQILPLKCFSNANYYVCVGRGAHEMTKEPTVVQQYMFITL